MTELRRGFLYWAHLDKWRPALVVSPDVRNARAHDVIVVPCSTVVRASPTHVALRRDEAGVPAASVLKCEQLTTLHKDDVRTAALGGPLSSSKISEVERAILRAVGVPVPLP